MKTPPQPKQFWIVNICNRDINISDLAINIRAYNSINLLDSKHYHLSWNQIFMSVTAGSIFRQRNKIIIRKHAPKPEKRIIPVDNISAIPNREKSIYEIKESTFEELDISDEQFAEESAELSE